MQDNSQAKAQKALDALICDDVNTYATLMLEAANEGNLMAQGILGRAFLYGEHIFPVDYQKALYWNSLAAEGGSVTAKVVLAKIYRTGPQGIRNLAMALEWAQAAANQGSMEGVSLMALTYMDLNDVDKAYYWAQKAADLGDEDGKKLVKEIRMQKLKSATNSAANKTISIIKVVVCTALVLIAALIFFLIKFGSLL